MNVNIVASETVDFYGDPIEVGMDDDNNPFVSLPQITGYLGLDIDEVMDRFENDPRVSIEDFNGSPVIPLMKLNGFLMLIEPSSVSEEFKQDLLRYQIECFEALHDYWIEGLAVNRREVPYKINSKFKDERQVSRKSLTEACIKVCKDRADLEPDDVFNKVMEYSYKIVGIKPGSEFESMKGSDARFLAWVESIYANVLNKYAVWNEVYPDPVKEASTHVEKHLHETGRAFMTMSGSMPDSMFTH